VRALFCNEALTTAQCGDAWVAHCEREPQVAHAQGEGRRHSRSSLLATSRPRGGSFWVLLALTCRRKMRSHCHAGGVVGARQLKRLARHNNKNCLLGALHTCFMELDGHVVGAGWVWLAGASSKLAAPLLLRQ